MQIDADIVLQAEFRDRSGTLINPDIVSGSIRNPAGVLSVIIFLVTSKVGVWECIYTPSAPGKYWWRVESVGSGIRAAAEKSFIVETPHVQ